MTAPIRVTVWNEFWHENPHALGGGPAVLDEPWLQRRERY